MDLRSGLQFGDRVRRLCSREPKRCVASDIESAARAHTLAQTAIQRALSMKPIAFVFVLAWVSPTQAATINAASCSRTDVVSAITSAKPGDTVQVPAGTCSWSGGVSFTGIQLVGAGSSPSGTVITAGLVTMTKHATAYTRLGRLRFTGTDEHIYAGGSPAAKPYIIDNNYIRSDASGNEAR